MYKDAATEMFDIIRAGGSVKCPLCKDGKIVPVGDRRTTKVIKCDNCGKGTVLTVPLETNKN